MESDGLGRPVLYNVAQLLKEPIGSTRQYHLQGELVDVDENNAGQTPLEGDVLFVRTLRGILVTGSLHLKLVQSCRRCLELSEDLLTLEIEEEFVPSIDVETGVKLELSEDDTPELLIDEHHHLDLSETLRQYVVTANTGMGLCKADCRGLCPVCGANLNIEPCQCHRSDIDPRLAALAVLLDHASNNES
jgi:uncharacterized protein